MTDLPLPEPVAWRSDAQFWQNIKHSLSPCIGLVQYAYTADQLHAYAAAKTAELQAECGKLQADIFHLRDDFSEMAALKNKVEAECARLREDGLAAAIERAARELPAGYEICIMIEKDAATVDATDWDGDPIELSPDYTMTQAVHAATDAALRGKDTK